MIIDAIEKSWSKIAPFWPLQNLIAVNPLYGFEDLPFKEALAAGKAYFQQEDLPDPMCIINRETIKWLQVFFDEGQATIQMPNRHLGLLKSIRHLLPFDDTYKAGDWLNQLPESSGQIIECCLRSLEIPEEDYEQFLTLMLTTLPGWASYLQYRASWGNGCTQDASLPLKQEYLAVRLILTCVHWPKARMLLQWHIQALKNADVQKVLEDLEKTESEYRKSLIEKLSKQTGTTEEEEVDVQLVFCIDVRSEPFRRSLEAQGPYQTYGFAGFFGVPVFVQNDISGAKRASCPVLLKPHHSLTEYPAYSKEKCQTGYEKKQIIKKLYQSLKYNFVTPFALVELIGVAAAFWMGVRSIFPKFGQFLKTKMSKNLHQTVQFVSDIQQIPFEDQCAFAEGALKVMGLTTNFASIVVFCGHGSTTQNNAFATALNCGACGGHQGGSNARVLSDILNNAQIRLSLKKKNIDIPASTHFLAAEHNTTTDEVILWDYDAPEIVRARLKKLKKDLSLATENNSQRRCQEMDVKCKSGAGAKHTFLRANDWAQVRPEWGLARNVAFIVGPRSLTKDIDLEGRGFLHSYDWAADGDGSCLSTILTAPMVVAQWINMQYLFSTLNNVAYGCGSKITKNITGKIGIMQGNASDLMHGLPLQSLFKTDVDPYHQPARLQTIVYAPRQLLNQIIEEQAVLKKLFGNEWVQLICIEPNDNAVFLLERDLKRKNSFFFNKQIDFKKTLSC